MKKNLLLFICLSFSFLLKAQKMDKAAALQLVTKNSTVIGLSNEDLKDVIISDAYTDHFAGTEMIYLQQSYKGLPVFNQLQVLAFKNGKVVSNAGGRIADIKKISGDASEKAIVTAEQAVRTAMAEKNIVTNENVFGYAEASGKKLNFGKLGIAHEDITAELMWVPLNDGKKVRLAWQVYLVPTRSSDYWMIRVDASNNKVIDQNNLTVYCSWDPAKKAVFADNLVSGKVHEQTVLKPLINNLFDFNNSNGGQKTSVSPLIINSATYRVVPFPAESPKHPGGTPALRTDPWTSAPGNATSLKWHSNGTTDYTITRGNNAWAKEDHASNNSNNGQPATSTTPDPLTFDFVPDFHKRPNQTTPVPNQQFNITNLFYWLNTYHDILYQYGFDEPAGNFQANNQGRGGAGNDYVFGDAQDGNFGVGNQNNANFSTPTDGNNGRMQMYLWDTAALLNVNAPAAIAGPVAAVESGFSTQNKLINLGPVTGDVVYYNDNGAGTTHEACGPPANSLAGKIALIDRGNCTFVIKVKNAQDAGAIGVIMVNNVDGNLVTMAGNDNTITIPAVFISLDDGFFIKQQIANNVNVTLSATNMDGDVDNGVICHEHSHGLSNRLTGGPSNASCLANAEQAGEGWSDYYGLMLTQDWANSNLNTGFNSPRGIGTYVIGQLPSGSGIRTQKYCTDFTVNNLVYSASLPANPLSHDRGEIWCATLWDMTWDIINQVGTINSNLYDATNGGGNTIAMKLVTEGMKLQPCSPGFIDGRNAILQADQLLYNGAHVCVIKEAFRRRGMGDNASQGSSNSVTDQVADFAPINCASCTSVGVTTQPAATTACTGGTATFSVVVDGTTPTYQWQSSTGGGPFLDITGANSATLTLTNVTSGMNGNQYHVVVTNTCPSTITSTAVTLTVNDPANITSQPVSFTACAGANASFSVTATGSANTYQWQVSTGGGPFGDITGATSNTLTIPNITGTLNGNQYHVVITSCGPAGITSSNVTLTVNTPATITAQPANTNACTGGGDATFTVATTGGAATYQWQVSTGGGPFLDISGATVATLTVTGITSAMNGNLYQVIISNPCTAAFTSSQATLAVSDPASITTQPAASTVCAGSNTSFTIVTAGTGVTYQWQVSTGGGPFADIAGATGATLNLTGVTASMNNNQYHVLVFSCSPAGISSNDVTLTVNSPVSITAQPQNITACVGTDATISITAGGTANSYQWQVSTGGGPFGDILGATSATLTLTAVTAGMNNNVYHVIITNTCTPAAVISSGATLTVSNAAAITTQPINTTVCAGLDATIAATASGSSYQWQVSTGGGPFTDITGANTTTLTLTGVTPSMNNNQYQLVIGSCGATSINTNPVTLTVNNPAVITAQPVNTITVCTGNDATFTVTAGGTSPTYQWQESIAGGPFTNITGATSAILTLTGVTGAMNGNQYQVIVSNTCTPGLTSGAGTLTVTAASSITTEPANTTICEGTAASFTVETANAPGATYQWQVSTGGGPFTDITNANSATLTVPSVTNSMNNNTYHVLITACGSLTSADAVLLVNALPVVAITVSPSESLTPGEAATLTATATPPASTFSWYNNDILVPGATTNTITVAYEDTGTYKAYVTDANGCSNNSNFITIKGQGIAFIYPNPNNGFFYVTFGGTQYNGKPRYITMYDGKGAKVYEKGYVTVSSFEKMEVHAAFLSKGVYALILSDSDGNVLGTGKVLIQ